LEVIGIYFSRNGIIRQKYNLFVVINNANKKEIYNIFEGVSFSYHQTYGNSAEIIFKANKEKTKTIVDKLKEMEFSDAGERGLNKLLKTLE
jgi:hypothetical protein